MTTLSLAELLVVIVGGIWVLLILIYLIYKDIKDRKYNKVLMTKEQMYKQGKFK